MRVSGDHYALQRRFAAGINYAKFLRFGHLFATRACRTRQCRVQSERRQSFGATRLVDQREQLSLKSSLVKIDGRLDGRVIAQLLYIGALLTIIIEPTDGVLLGRRRRLDNACKDDCPQHYSKKDVDCYVRAVQRSPCAGRRDGVCCLFLNGFSEIHCLPLCVVYTIRQKMSLVLLRHFTFKRNSGILVTQRNGGINAIRITKNLAKVSFTFARFHFLDQRVLSNPRQSVHRFPALAHRLAQVRFHFLFRPQSHLFH